MLAILQAQSEHGQEQEMSCSATLNEPQLHYKPEAFLGALRLRVLLLKQQSTKWARISTTRTTWQEGLRNAGHPGTGPVYKDVLTPNYSSCFENVFSVYTRVTEILPAIVLLQVP